MVFDLASGALAVVALLVFWLAPLAVFLLSTRVHGLEKLNWALLIGVLSWPGYAVYLFYSGVKQRNS